MNKVKISEASYVWMTDASNSIDYFRVLPENINSYLEKGFIMYEKKCVECKTTKPSFDFYVCNAKKDGYTNRCKICTGKYYKNDRENRSNKAKKYYKENQEKLKSQSALYYKENKSSCIKKSVEWSRRKYKTDKKYKLVKVLRNRIHGAIKGKCGSSSCLTLLGCDPNTARRYLENKFQPGMTWDNHGEWHIDHIIPCAAFDLTKEEEQRRCFHYTNLQPLWAKDNLRKGGRY